MLPGGWLCYSLGYIQLVASTAGRSTGVSHPSGTLVALHMASLCPWWHSSVSGSQTPRTVTGFSEKKEPGSPLTAWVCKSQNITSAIFCHRVGHKALIEWRRNGLCLLRAEQHVHTEREGMTLWPTMDTDWVLFSQLLILILILSFYPQFTIWSILFCTLSLIIISSYPSVASSHFLLM